MRLRASSPLPIAGTTILLLLIASPALGRSGARALTGFGATRKAWFAHHTPDPNPKLIRGCCFLPKQHDGQDRYYAVQYMSGRVLTYSMHYAPRLPASLVKHLMAHEIPPDARLVAHARKATCEQFVYRSARLEAAAHTGRVMVEFSANGVGGPYRGVVGDVILLPLGSTHFGC